VAYGKKRPTIKVLPWPAIPAPTVDEVYAGVDEKRKEYSLWVESAVRQQFNADKPESLDGIRVLDMTANMEIGHWCSSHFSELGPRSSWSSPRAATRSGS